MIESARDPHCPKVSQNLILPYTGHKFVHWFILKIFI